MYFDPLPDSDNADVGNFMQFICAALMSGRHFLYPPKNERKYSKDEKLKNTGAR